MARMLQSRTVFVDEVVSALTGGLKGVPARSLSDSLQRAAAEFDERTAEAFAHALFQALEADPADLGQREALLLLGMSHPSVFARHSISLASEAQRYAQLLELHGDPVRAAEVRALIPRESLPVQLDPGTQARIQSVLARAEEHIRCGRSRQAQQDLREVLSLDPSRGDVTHMLGILCRSRAASRRVRRRIIGSAAALAVVALGAVGLLRHEQQMQELYAQLPAADRADPASLQSRLAALETLLEANLPWSGTVRAWDDRDELQRAIRSGEDQLVADQLLVADERDRQLEDADDLRASAFVLLERGESTLALQQLKLALVTGGASWRQREAVRADIAAIEDWQRQQLAQGRGR